MNSGGCSTFDLCVEVVIGLGLDQTGPDLPRPKIEMGKGRRLETRPIHGQTGSVKSGPKQQNPKLARGRAKLKSIVQKRKNLCSIATFQPIFAKMQKPA